MIMVYDSLPDDESESTSDHSQTTFTKMGEGS